MDPKTSNFVDQPLSDIAQGPSRGTIEYKQYINPALPQSRLHDGDTDTVSRRAKDDGKFFIHISDTHHDPFFDPEATMGAAICHSCLFSEEVFGSEAYCPRTLPTNEASIEIGQYPFGRYGCNPPRRLVDSLYHAMKGIDAHPRFVVMTGDLAPHGYPGDKATLTNTTTFEDLCPTKLLIMKRQAAFWKQHFPHTKLVFTLGNNDHFPKDKYWQPFITALGDVFHEEGLFTKKEHEMFTRYGSVYYDIDNLRFIALDFTLFTPGGEVTFVDPASLSGLSEEETACELFPVRHRTIQWFERTLKEAREQKKAVYIVGHQPLTTKRGKDELNVYGVHYGKLKFLLDRYQDIIKVGLFGHRNLAAIQPIASALGRPIIPSITVPGVSPRGKNHPAFHVVFYEADGTVHDFEQWVFALGNENAKASKEGKGYKGEWKMHHRELYSWKAFSKGEKFTVAGLMHTLHSILTDERVFFDIELWKRGGYVGDETPENYKCKAKYDTANAMMQCLFPKQDPRCWDQKWLA
uniref:Calcineurin-like phosphoesterase domain-containing protein n=1 Tax=Eutreptiella gymnastica TaxID=73025 RepID=A0A6T2AYJ6_9EUGL